MTGNVDLGNNGRGVYIGSGSNNVIGDVNGNGNLISGNSVGIQVDSSSNVQVVNNLVGVNAAGTAALGNQQQGILVQNSSAATVRLNFVSANGGNGIELGGSVSGASVRRNTIGMPNGSATALRNTGHGILISSSSNNTIGSATDGAEGNVIWGNGANGIAVVAPATGNAIRRNSLLGNTLRGIDLANNGVTANDVGDADTGANNLQNFPVLATAARRRSGHAEQPAEPDLSGRVLHQRELRSFRQRGRGEPGRIGVRRHGCQRQRDTPILPYRRGCPGHRDGDVADRRHLGVLGVRHIRSVERAAGRQRGRRPERQCRQRRATQRHRLERSGF